MELRIAPNEQNNQLLAELFYNDYDISDETIDQILELPREELINNLETTIKYGIEHFERVRKSDKDSGTRSSFPLYALFLLTVLKSEESFPLFLELCKCDEEILDYYFGDHPTETMWQDAMILGFNQVNEFVQFLKDGEGKSFGGNCIVSDGLTQLYLHYPEKQQEIKAAFKEILEFLWAKDKKDDDHELNETILNAVADTRDIDLFPLCKPFYDESRTECYMTVNWEEFEEILNGEGNYKRTILDIRNRINYFETMQRNFHQFENDLKYHNPIVNTESKTQRNDACPCGSGLKYKKCCMNNKMKLDFE